MSKEIRATIDNATVSMLEAAASGSLIVALAGVPKAIEIGRGAPGIFAFFIAMNAAALFCSVWANVTRRWTSLRMESRNNQEDSYGLFNWRPEWLEQRNSLLIFGSASLIAVSYFCLSFQLFWWS
ncbi:hypothetical protein [Oceanibium sediminis]|uniref:hypothetical protein n=1 Tax=Oceanibium sediminis TaxID=2026339 RepID=UPI000DD31F5C|nr:hypothetical protein [Oceanibium sediminis]